MMGSLFLRTPLLLLLLQSAPASWQDLYNKGLEQVKAGDGRKAIGFLSQAAKANPQPSVSPRYTPYFYMGLCYDSIGDEKNALLYYQKSEALKEVKSFPEDEEVLQTNIRELRESSRDFQVIIKEGQAAGSKDKPPQNVTEATPKRNEVAESRPPNAGPGGTTKPVSGSGTPVTGELVKDQGSQMLRQAVLQYLSGDYSSALRTARSYLDQGGRQVDKASFVAGASLFSQFLLTGQTDQSLERSADRYLKDASPYSPPRNWISPAVLEHYRQVTKE